MIPLQNYTLVYAIGIGGSGMSALVRLLSAYGLPIFGYDQVESNMVLALRKEGCIIHCQVDDQTIPDKVHCNLKKTLVVTTPAIASNHPVRRFFEQSGCKVWLRAEVLAWIANQCHCLAVAGTHGKTTTTALMAHMLYQSHIPSMALVGGVVKRYQANYLCNTTWPAKHMIVEADEFNRSFLHLFPKESIVTSVDMDHLESYGSKALLKQGFRQFIAQTQKQVWMHYRVEERLALDQTAGQSLITYGIDQGHVQARRITFQKYKSKFDYVSPWQVISAIELPLPGSYNIENALAVITVGLAWGLSKETICQALAGFPGVERRFSTVFEHKHCLLIDDYAHHPVEVGAIIRTIKQLYKHSKLTVIFQPHLFSRTKQWYQAFAKQLSLADTVLLLPIYPAREAPIPGVCAALIFHALTCPEKYLVTMDNVYDYFAVKSKAAHQVVLVLGAGDIYVILPTLAKILKQTYAV